MVAGLNDRPATRPGPAVGFSFTDTADGLRYDETRGNGTWRTAFGIAGALALLGSGIFIFLLSQATGPLDAARVGGIAASVLGLLAFWAFGLFCLYVALIAPQQTLLFDRARGRIVRTQTAPLRGLRRPPVHIPCEDVVELRVYEQRWSEDPSSFGVEVQLKHARPLRLGSFDDRATAAAHVERLRTALGRP